MFTSILLGASSLSVVTIYPFMKRVTYWPQAVLGEALSFWNPSHANISAVYNYRSCFQLGRFTRLVRSGRLRELASGTPVIRWWLLLDTGIRYHLRQPGV